MATVFPIAYVDGGMRAATGLCLSSETFLFKGEGLVDDLIKGERKRNKR